MYAIDGRVRLLLTAEDENGIAGEGELAAAATEAEAGAETEGQRNAPSEMGLEGKWTVEENEVGVRVRARARRTDRDMAERYTDR